MRNALRLAVFACMSLCVCVLAHAQVGPPTTIIPTPTAPTGNCSSTSIRLLTPNGTLYTCTFGNWAPESGGTGGGGTSPTSGIISGCGIEYTGGLSFTIGACNYVIAGQSYTSPASTVTLGAADMTNPRIDVIAVNTAQAVVVIPGTPAMSPIAPTVDYSTQLPLTFQTVAANATTPSNVVSTLIYDENVGPATEWTCSSTANINCNSTSNPYHGTKDVEATLAVLNNDVLFTIGSSNVNLQTQNALVFYLRSKAAWPTGNGGANAKRVLSLFWISSGTTQVGNQVTVQDGAFGFSSSTIGSYQQISIPVGLFQTGSTVVTKLEIKVAGNSGSSSIGFYIDEVTLQSGNTPGTNGQFMTFRGTWSSTAAYNVNDVVMDSNNAFAYVALLANANVALSTLSTWQLLATIPPTVCTSQFISSIAAGTGAGTCSSLTAAEIPAVNFATPGSSHTFTNKADIFVCTTTCTITVPVPAAGLQYCVMNDDNVATVITLSAIGSSARYENQARTAYGTAGTGTLVSAGAVKDFVCLLGRDSTHYLFASGGGTWTAN